jgi:hypothetical protein
MQRHRRHGGLTKPVGQHKGRLLGKVTVVKDEQEFGAVLAQALQRVGDAAGEVPQVALLEVAKVGASLVVEGGDADLAVEDVGPLGLLVPVQLANDARVEAHVDRGQLAASAELTDRRLAGPAALLDADVRVGEAPAHVGQVATVGAGRARHVRVLACARRVPGPEDGRAQAVAPGKRVDIVANGVDKVVVRVAVAGRVGRRVGLEPLGQLEAVEQPLLGAVKVREGEGDASAGGDEGELHGGIEGQRGREAERQLIGVNWVRGWACRAASWS